MTEDLEKRIAAIEEQLSDIDAALRAQIEAGLESGAYMVALTRLLELAGIIKEEQMRIEVTRAKEELSRIASDQGNDFLSLLLKPDEDPGSVQ